MTGTIPNLKGVNIVLIGMMGSGKTTTGQILAEQLNYKFFDTDSLIEQLADQSINDIFAQSGETTFRELETKVLSELSSYRQLVIATGGGIVLNPMNWSYLRHGLVVWLNVETDLIWARLQDEQTRPLLKTESPLATLKAKVEEREPLYAQADVEVEITQPLDASIISQQVLDAIQLQLRDEAQSS